MVLVLGAFVSIVLGALMPLLGVMSAMVVMHFFLFCNVLRLPQRLELTWSAGFIVFSASALLYGVPPWPVWLGLVMTLTIIVTLLGIRLPSYHGVFRQFFNPNLSRQARQQAAKSDHDVISQVLLKEWDPIGVSEIDEAQDEYDAYVPGVHKLLIHRCTSQELFDYLWQIETEHMGLCGNRGHTEEIAKRLIGLSR